MNEKRKAYLKIKNRAYYRRDTIKKADEELDKLYLTFPYAESYDDKDCIEALSILKKIIKYRKLKQKNEHKLKKSKQ